MAASAVPYLEIVNRDEKLCLICEKRITSKEKHEQFTDQGWNNFKEQCKKWNRFNVPTHNSKFLYTKVYGKIENVPSASGFAHETCRTNIRTKAALFETRYGLIADNSTVQDHNFDTELSEVKGVVPRNYCAVFLSEIDWFLAKIVFDKV